MIFGYCVMYENNPQAALFYYLQITHHFTRKVAYPYHYHLLDVYCFRLRYIYRFVFSYRSCSTKCMLELIEPLTLYDWFEFYETFSYADFHLVRFDDAKV